MGIKNSIEKFASIGLIVTLSAIAVFFIAGFLFHKNIINELTYILTVLLVVFFAGVKCKYLYDTYRITQPIISKNKDEYLNVGGVYYKK